MYLLKKFFNDIFLEVLKYQRKVPVKKSQYFLKVLWENLMQNEKFGLDKKSQKHPKDIDFCKNVCLGVVTTYKNWI